MRRHVLACAAIVVATIAIAPPTRAAEPNWPDSLTIGTASPGGTYYVYGEGLARILTRDLDLPVAMRPTEGPAENIALLEAGEAKLGFVTVGVALQAWNATGVWAGKTPARALRAIFPMYDTPFQLLALQDTNIRSVADMAGKRIGVGPRGGTSATYFPDIFNALKVSGTFVHGDWSDLAAQIPLAAEQIAALRLAMPELTPSRVPAGTYPSLLRHYQTVGLYNFAVAHADLPNDLVYNIVRIVFERHEEMMEVHAAAAATVPATSPRRHSLLPPDRARRTDGLDSGRSRP